MYYIYHIKGVKIGVSTKPENRVNKQGYSDYEILEEHTDIDEVSKRERELQKEYGYRVDELLYSESYNRLSKAWAKGGKIMGKLKRKLTYDDAQQIRAEYSLGSINQRQLAKMYNVDQGTIANIIHNRLYLTP